MKEEDIIKNTINCAMVTNYSGVVFEKELYFETCKNHINFLKNKEMLDDFCNFMTRKVENKIYKP